MSDRRRFVGLFLMLFGIGLMAAFTALVASYLVCQKVTGDTPQIENDPDASL